MDNHYCIYPWLVTNSRSIPADGTSLEQCPMMGENGVLSLSQRNTPVKTIPQIDGTIFYCIFGKITLF
jgi:hypothetical protein